MMRNFSKIESNAEQQGYILPFVLVLLIILLLSSATFFNRATTSASISGQQRDTTQALLLAESVLNRFTGRLLSGSRESPFVSTGINNLDGGAQDQLQDLYQIAAAIPSLGLPPAGTLPPYVFYIADGKGAISAVQPAKRASHILQAVANGESRTTNSNIGIASQKIGKTITNIRINDLFVGNSARPLLFAVSASGIPAISAAADWKAETAPSKAAVWVELVGDTNNRLHIYASAAVQTGTTRTYLQRRIGDFNYNSPKTLGGLVSPLSESGNRL